MMSRRTALTAALAALPLWTAGPPALRAQGAAGAAPVATPAPQQEVPRPRRTFASVAGFYNRLSDPYGSWRGADARIQYATPRVTPFLMASTQTRPEGSQQSIGLGSYVVFNRWVYTIVGVSGAPDGSAVLYPRLRLDASVLANVPGVQGLVATAGITEIDFEGPGGGRIWSVGSMYYRGRLIVIDVVRFNRDRVSGAGSASGLVAAQYGVQGEYWLGASVGGGREAYQVLAATPFDVRFRSVGGSAFLQQWLSPAGGLLLRYEYEHKLTAYRRHGLSAGAFVEF